MPDSQIAGGADPRDAVTWISRPGRARLEALLEDPVTRLVMQRDGVERESLLKTMQTVRARLRKARGARRPAPRTAPAFRE